MSADNLKILALDFDGVICDGLIEYFQTTKRTYCKIWTEDNPPSEDLAESFYRLRPVIETGWEMPVLLRALVLGNYSEENILDNWHEIAQEIIKKENKDPKTLVNTLDTTRDKWIESDLESWLELHRFYPGVIEKIRKIMDSEIELYIVTTKEGRFVKRLLKKSGIELPAAQIIGKESKRPKYETLREIIQKANLKDINLWFVEDRLKTLELVKKQPDLEGVGLYLADWGYNTSRSKELARKDRRIQLISLEQFSQDFTTWGG